MTTNDIGFSIKVLPVGAEIWGLDASQPIGEATRKALYQAWLQNGILIFKETPVTNAQHLALSRCFGEIEKHPMQQLWADEEPYLMELGGKNTVTPAFVYNGTELRTGRLPYHRDTGYIPEICKGAMLRFVELPDEDGETCFADTQKAYDTLPAALKQRIENLEFKATLRIGAFSQSGPGATWQTVRAPTNEEWPHAPVRMPGADVMHQYPSVVHPVVIRHPETGCKSVYFSPTYVDEFLGVDRYEGEILLAELVGYMLDTRVTYTHKWNFNELIIWDNRRMLHGALGYHPKYTRRGLRTTLKETLHSGRYYAPQKNDFKPAELIAD